MIDLTTIPVPYAVTLPLKRGRKPLDLDDAAIVAAYLDGAKVKDIAAKNYCSTGYIYAALRSAQVNRKQGRPKTKEGLLDIKRAKAMAQKYQSGMTLQEIGDEYGITRERARKIIRKVGLAPDGVRRISAARLPVRLAKVAKVIAAEKKAAFRDQRTSDIIDAYQRGYKLREIAAMFDIAALHSISALMRKHGVPLRKNSSPTKFNDEQRKAAVDRVLRGEKNAAVANDIGASVSAIHAWVNSARALTAQVPASPSPPLASV